MLPSRIHLSTLLSLTLISSMGCEDLPTPALPRVELTKPVVTSDGRGGYEWQIVQGKFPVERKYDFPLIQAIDRATFDANLQRKEYQEPTQPNRFEGLTDDGYEIIARWTEPHFYDPPVFELRPSTDVDTHHFSVSRDGTKLATAGKKITVWDLATKQPVRTLNNPLSKVIFIQFGPDAQTLFIADQQNLVRLNVTDQTEARFHLDSGSIDSIAVARDTMQCALLLHNREMVHVDEQMQATRKVSRIPIVGTRIAISPNGTRVIAQGEKDLIRWHTEGNVGLIEPVPFARLGQGSGIPLVGVQRERIIFPKEIFEQPVDRSKTPAMNSDGVQAPPTTTRDVFYWFHEPAFAFAATKSGQQDWVAVAYEQVASDGKKSFVITDISASDGTYSVPFVIDEAVPKAMECSQSTEVIAFENGAGALKVIRRHRWRDATGTIFERLAHLVAEGQGEQAERIADILAEIPVHKLKIEGQEVYRAIAGQIGDMWMQADRNEGDANADRMVHAFEAWHKRGSHLSRAAEAYKLAWLTNFGLDDVNYNRINADRRKAWTIARQLLDEDDRFSAMYPLIAELTNMIGVSDEMLSDQFGKVMSQHPYWAMPLFIHCFFESPMRGGESGKAQALLAAYCKLLPEPERKRFYSEVALLTLGASDIRRGIDEYRFRLGTIFEGMEIAMDRHDLSSSMAIRALELAVIQGDQQRQKQILKYCSERFPMMRSPRASEEAHSAIGRYLFPR